MNGAARRRSPRSCSPRGVGANPAAGAMKYSAYDIEAEEMDDVLSVFPGIGKYQQTLESSVMDIADDIAYAVHDLDDFYRAGILQYTSVSAQLRAWLDNSVRFQALKAPELDQRQPGHALEITWRHVLAKDRWIAKSEAFRASVQRVGHDLVDG